MPPLPGEDRLLTVFADVHYYFSPPTIRPLHHRFDKGSYVYLYDDPRRRRARLEIANNPGTPDQDAFQGTLDAVHMRYSHKFPTLCTVTVDALPVTPAGSSPPPDQTSEWRLPSHDPRDEGRFLFRLHTLDLYFWTLEDAQLFMDSAKKVLSSRQLEISEPPEKSSYHQVVSPVVQQLEKMAISDPAYHNGQTPNFTNQTTTPLPPPPPMPAPTLPQQSSAPQSSPDQSPKAPESQPSNFAPMAYNPAAPAAPEPIKHREKTPPPPDGDQGTGLAGAVAVDHGLIHNPAGTPAHVDPGLIHNPAGSPAPYYAGPGATAVPPPPAPWGSPPAPGVGISHNPSVSSNTSARQSTTATPYGPGAAVPGAPSRQGSVASQSFAAPPTQAHGPHASPYGQSTPPVQSPSTQIYGAAPFSGTPQPHAPLAHLQPQYADYLQQKPQPVPPPGGYANYQYGQEGGHHHHQPSGGNEYDVHSQVYRPTEDEARVHSHRHSSTSQVGGKPGKVETGVNRFLKKLEKKIG